MKFVFGDCSLAILGLWSDAKSPRIVVTVTNEQQRERQSESFVVVVVVVGTWSKDRGMRAVDGKKKLKAKSKKEIKKEKIKSKS